MKACFTKIKFQKALTRLKENVDVCDTIEYVMQLSLYAKNKRTNIVPNCKNFENIVRHLENNRQLNHYLAKKRVKTFFHKQLKRESRRRAFEIPTRIPKAQKPNKAFHTSLPTY